MSSSVRFTKHAVLALSGIALVLGGSAVGSGCTTTTEEIQAADGGSDAASDAKKFDSATPPDEDSGPPKQTEDECIAECEKKHAAGLTLDKKIDTCWETKCKGPCVDDTKVFDGGVGDAGDAGGDAGAGKCTNEVDTGEDACDKCTSANCCAEWDGCFNDTDCEALNTCRNDCVQ